MTCSSRFESATDVLARKPFIASYDLGYEYGQEHCISLQSMVEDADVGVSLQESRPSPPKKHAAVQRNLAKNSAA